MRIALGAAAAAVSVACLTGCSNITDEVSRSGVVAWAQPNDAVSPSVTYFQLAGSSTAYHCSWTAHKECAVVRVGVFVEVEAGHYQHYGRSLDYHDYVNHLIVHADSLSSAPTPS